MNRDFNDLLRVFNEYQVRYLIIGGYAVIQHSEPRYTKDLDLWVAPDDENAARVYKALIDFGAPIEELKVKDFTDEGSFFTMGTPPNRIDIWFTLKGVDIETVWDRRQEEMLEGLKVNFISRKT